MILETERVLLKKPEGDQIDYVAPLFGDANVMRYIVTGKVRSREEALQSIAKNQEHWDRFGFGFFNAIEKATGRFIGRCGLLHIAYQHDHPDVEVGYLLHEAFWGKGYGKEIAKRLTDWGLEELKLKEIYGICWRENIASCKILEGVGMVFDREDVYPGTEHLSLFFRLDRPL